MQTLADLARDLATGQTTARALIEQSLAAIADPDGEGGVTFLRVYAEQARASADAIDALRRAGRAPGPYAGIPVSLKDLLDVAGEPTRAGSIALADVPPATQNAEVVDRLLAAGFVPVGRTNMTEFAYSGLGINPHYGTPRSPWDRATGRLPGGSSSGAAVSVVDGMAPVGIGTDTGGSCRIPAALCGVVGYKPTARRVPKTGVLPLSGTLDSVGPLAGSVACCAVFDAILAGEPAAPPVTASVAGLRLAVPENLVLDHLDAPVAADFDRALAALREAGASITIQPFPALDRIPAANFKGGFTAPESFAWHRALIAAKGGSYDPRVRHRIQRGETMSAVEYLDLLAARASIIAEMDAATADFGALVLPTVPLIPPPIADMADETVYTRTNQLLLRNTAFGNFLDRCAISLPCHTPGTAPVGLMIMGETMGDARLFRLASRIEAVINRKRGA